MIQRSIILALTIANCVSAMDQSEHIPQENLDNQLEAQLLDRQKLFRQLLAAHAYGDYQSLQAIAAQLGDYNRPTPSRQAQQELTSFRPLSISPLFIALMATIVAGCIQLYNLL